MKVVGNKTKRRISKRVFQENRKQSTINFPKNEHFFFRKFDVLCFETPVFRYALLLYYRRSQLHSYAKYETKNRDK